jgi:hypothetical protein
MITSECFHHSTRNEFAMVTELALGVTLCHTNLTQFFSESLESTQSKLCHGVSILTQILKGRTVT